MTPEQPRGVFITGTDTAVGKTVAAALLTLALDAAYWKPVQSGACEGDEAAAVQSMTGLPAARFHRPAYSFAAALSPHAAARYENTVIDLARIALPKSDRFLVVEGAGGVLAPLSDTASMVDLLSHLGLPVLVVARSALGTINHTLLTLEALERRGVRVLGLLLNGPPNPGNRAALEQFCRAPVLAEIPHLPDLAPATLGAAAQGLAALRQLFLTVAPDRPDAISDAIVELDSQHVWHPFTQAATAPPLLEIVSAAGSTLYGKDGRQYQDLVSSWWVTTHGHCHSAIAAAVAAQAATLDQALFADFTHAPAARLAAALCARLPASLTRVFYSDDGSTAVEAALKMAHQYWRNRVGPGKAPRDRFIALRGGYHGDTVGAMSLGFSSGFYDGYAALTFGVDFASFPATWLGDEHAAEREAAALAELEALLQAGAGRVAAIVLEPLIQGAAGMRMCRPEYLRAVAALARGYDVLLIFDEVMTGFGRTGTLFAMEQAGVAPDIVCLSKCLTGGFLPLAATVASEAVFAAFRGPTFEKAFAHGHSYTANPLGCAAALASLELFEREATLTRVASIGRLHNARLARLASHPAVQQPRTRGVIAALDIAPDGKGATAGYDAALGRRLKAFFLERGLFVRPLGNVFYLLPPYCVSDETLHRAYDVLEEFLDHFNIEKF